MITLFENYEKMTPEDAVLDMVQHEGYVSVKESIDAWNRVKQTNTIYENI